VRWARLAHVSPSKRAHFPSDRSSTTRPHPVDGILQCGAAGVRVMEVDGMPMHDLSSTQPLMKSLNANPGPVPRPSLVGYVEHISRSLQCGNVNLRALFAESRLASSAQNQGPMESGARPPVTVSSPGATAPRLQPWEIDGWGRRHPPRLHGLPHGSEHRQLPRRRPYSR
jgi:hypothetical protein